MESISEEMILIDLGHDYYIFKFLKEENMPQICKHGHGFQWIFLVF